MSNKHKEIGFINVFRLKRVLIAMRALFCTTLGYLSFLMYYWCLMSMPQVLFASNIRHDVDFAFICTFSCFLLMVFCTGLSIFGIKKGLFVKSVSLCVGLILPGTYLFYAAHCRTVRHIGKDKLGDAIGHPVTILGLKVQTLHAENSNGKWIWYYDLD